MQQYAIQLVAKDGAEYPPVFYILADRMVMTSKSMEFYRDNAGSECIGQVIAAWVAAWWILPG